MRLILTGGFLGSGKTTAIVHACQLLMKEGKKVAVITNDQGDQQVDSAFTKSLEINTREVSNGCFCCRYSELEAHLSSLEAEQAPDIVFAESVGSCTDLIATIAKPLHQFKPNIEVIVSVFADTSLIASVMEGRASFLEESVRYIYRKQLEEADLIVLNKIDLVTKEQLANADSKMCKGYPKKNILHQDSHQKKDIATWLNTLNRFASSEKRNSLLLDYDLYGDGEAKMAWLDKAITIHSPLGNGGFIARQIIRSIFNQLIQQQLTIGHLKFFVQSDQWNEKISFTTATTSADFKISNKNIERLQLLINARIQTNPSTLQALVDQVIDSVRESGNCTIVTERQSAFSPGYPQPTHRIA